MVEIHQSLAGHEQGLGKVSMDAIEDFLIKAEDADLTAPGFAVLICQGKCWKCAQLTPMAAIWVPSYTEIDPEEGEHLVSEDAALLTYVGGLTTEVGRQVLAAAPWLRYAHTEGAGATYLANHCQQCDTVQGDWFVFGVNGPFFPQTAEEVARIQVVPCKGEFHGSANTAVSSWMSEIER